MTLVRGWFGDVGVICRGWRLLCAAGVVLSMAGTASAQDGWFTRYQARVGAAQVNQPRWATPLVTVSPRIEQGFRTDFTRQSLAGGRSSWNYGGAKGLQMIPLPRVELRFSPPAFFTHSTPKVEDGFGDVAFRLKYRIYGSNEEHHNAIATFDFGASVPTGKSGNGSCCAVLTPALEVGKGFGGFAVTTSIGGTLPVTNAKGLGQQIAWNTAAEYRATRFVWVDAEVNATYFEGGKNDGKGQTFLTPGLIVSRLPLIRRRGARGDVLAISLGLGEQIAVTHFSTYNHAPIATARLRF